MEVKGSQTIQKLLLVTPDLALHLAFEHAFQELPQVECVHGVFENLPEYDCFVTAGNSFGLMDGGVDLAVAQYFGPELVRRVQQKILNEYLGEQPVGTSFIVETGHPLHPFVAHTPTMRVPMTVSRTDYAYKAMWAALLAVHQHNRTSDRPIKILACTGLGTLTGQMPYHEAARQMALAYHNYLHPPTGLSWHVAEKRQEAIRFGGDYGLRFPLPKQG